MNITPNQYSYSSLSGRLACGPQSGMHLHLSHRLFKMELTMPSPERRRFSRVNFHSRAVLSQGEQKWNCELVDVSLKGLLINREVNQDFKADTPLSACINLGEDEQIHMQLILARSSDQQQGFTCTSIDVESIRHLRRLIELNLGDPEAAEREITEMILA